MKKKKMLLRRFARDKMLVHANKNTSGITLLSLVITIIVLIIITGVAVSAGISSIKSAKMTSFMTELEMIQEKVNTIYEKRKLNEEDIAYYHSLGQDVLVVDSSKLVDILNGKSKEGYRYFSKEDLKKLDLDNMGQDVIINFATRDVASVTGLLYEDKVCYRLTDFPSYRGQNIDYTNKNIQSPTFDVEVSKLSNSWQFTIKNVMYNSNVFGGILSYKLSGSENWILVGEKAYFEVTEPRIV